MLSAGGWAIWFLLVWLLLVLVASALTVRLLYVVWRSRKSGSIATKLLAAVVAATAIFGGGGTLIGLLKSFAAVGGENVDPSQKVRILAEGISEAISCTAFGLVTWLPPVIALLLVRNKSRRTVHPSPGHE